MVDTLSLDPSQPDLASVARAAEWLDRGGLVAFPTESFYGIGADYRNHAALRSLHRTKGRAPDAPILLLLASLDQLGAVSDEIPEALGLLARAFWPGPLTLVVRARDDLSRLLTAGTGTIGVRVPGLALARALPAALGRPVTGTSANLSGAPPARTASEVRASLGARIQLLIDGGPTPGGTPSTVVDLARGAPRLLRPGAIPFERVIDALSRH